MNKYFSILKSKSQRDSLLKKISRSTIQPQEEDTVYFKKREQDFTRYKGRYIRNIFYRTIKVFGTENIYDTSGSFGMKLINFANNLHTDTREWVIRQALFFRPGDTINAFKLADNERYLRNLTFIQDARIYIVNTRLNSDSADLFIATKDVFEYGFGLSQLTPGAFKANVFNKNLLGAGQNLELGVLWDKRFSPQWNTQMSYTKYNVAGSFTDFSIGYSKLNNRNPIDSGVHEQSYYINADRPLYSSWASFTGGVFFASNSSMNIFNAPDSLFRNYAYNIGDAWLGYNFRNQFKKNGAYSKKANMAIQVRSYILRFDRTPTQPKFADNPIYNDRRFLLSKFVLFKQDFFKTRNFFGFGITEDIPTGYAASAGVGTESWLNRKRLYSAIELQRYWLLPNLALLNTNVQLSSYWNNKKSEDEVIKIQLDYYSQLVKWKKKKIRQFINSEYIICPTPVFNRPLSIRNQFGINGYGNTSITGFQRLRFQSETRYYSPIKVYGFKFNFFALVQAALITNYDEAIFRSPLYSSFSLGCAIRNENLALNTLQINASYLPNSPEGVRRSFIIELKTIVDFRFNIFALRTPQQVVFQ